MAAIRSFSPAKSASSSSVSPVTMVLSMSAISSPLRRPRVLVAIASTGALAEGGANAVHVGRGVGRDVGGLARRQHHRLADAAAGADRVAHRVDDRRRQASSPRGRQRGSGHAASSLLRTAPVTRQVTQHKRALIVAGPTCSGKSALAIALARPPRRHRHQRRIRCRLSRAARPHRPPDAGGGSRASRTPCMASAPPPSPAASPGGAMPRSPRWKRRTRPAGCRSCAAAPACISLALTQGLADIPAAGRRGPRRGPRAAGASSARRRCTRASPNSRPGNRRPHRAPPTASASPARGRSGAAPAKGLAAWQSRKAASAPAPWRFTAILLDPPREALRAAIATRFAAMLAAGALEEVRALLALGLDPALPAMRAHGVPELAAHLRGDIHAGRGGAPRDAGHRPVHQAPGDLVPPPRPGPGIANAYDPCANRRSGAIFGK